MSGYNGTISGVIVANNVHKNVSKWVTKSMIMKLVTKTVHAGKRVVMSGCEMFVLVVL